MIRSSRKPHAARGVALVAALGLLLLDRATPCSGRAARFELPGHPSSGWVGTHPSPGGRRLSGLALRGAGLEENGARQEVLGRLGVPATASAGAEEGRDGSLPEGWRGGEWRGQRLNAPHEASRLLEALRGLEGQEMSLEELRTTVRSVVVHSEKGYVAREFQELSWEEQQAMIERRAETAVKLRLRQDPALPIRVFFAQRELPEYVRVVQVRQGFPYVLVLAEGEKLAKNLSGLEEGMVAVEGPGGSRQKYPPEFVAEAVAGGLVRGAGGTYTCEISFFDLDYYLEVRRRVAEDDASTPPVAVSGEGRAEQYSLDLVMAAWMRGIVTHEGGVFRLQEARGVASGGTISGTFEDIAALVEPVNTARKALGIIQIPLPGGQLDLPVPFGDGHETMLFLDGGVSWIKAEMRLPEGYDAPPPAIRLQCIPHEGSPRELKLSFNKWEGKYAGEADNVPAGAYTLRVLFGPSELGGLEEQARRVAERFA